jgi:hypothetical protein
MVRLRGLEELSFQFFGIPAGTWWVLLESDTQWSAVRDKHPWILVRDFSPRTAFAHAVPRSSRGSDDSIEQPPHQPGHDGEAMCFLDWKGWLIPGEMKQIDPVWFDHGWRSCLEPPGSGLLGRVQACVREIPS